MCGAEAAPISRRSAAAWPGHPPRPRLAVEVARQPATPVVFELLADGDRDLTGRPWPLRRQRLQTMEVDGERLVVNLVHDDGGRLWEADCAQLEGVVAYPSSCSRSTGRAGPPARG